MATDEAYWQKRRDRLLSQLERDEKKLYAKMDKVYASELSKIEQEIAAYYQLYGQDNVIKYRTLLLELSDSDRRLLMERMDDFVAKYPQYAQLMPIRESIYQLDRLEGLQYSIWMHQMEIGAIEDTVLAEHLRDYAQRSANLAAEELGYGSVYNMVDSQVIELTVGAAWAQGMSFSDRIWDNKAKLAAYLNDDFAKAVARGVSYEQLISELGERFTNVSRANIRRLVFTEGSFVFNEARAQVQSKDYEYYRLSCATELQTARTSKVCETCRDIERQQMEEPVRFDDRKPGVNFPPIHPNCRCITLIVIPDAEEWGERFVARHGGDYIQERDRPDLNYLHPGAITYDKPRASFLGAEDEKDLAVHEALARAGHSVRVLPEDAPDGYSNIDIEMDGKLWEIKSPVGSNIRAIESNLRKAKRQFKKHYPDELNASRVIVSLNQFLVDEETAIEKIKFEKKRHGIDQVIVMLKDGSLREL